MYREEGERLQEHRQNRRLWWELSLNTNTQTHTLRHSATGSLGAISLLAILLMLASLMVVNVFRWTLRTVLYHLAFTSLCGRSSLYKPDVDSHVLTCTRGRPVFKTKNRKAPITTHTEGVWLQPQVRTPLLCYIFTQQMVVCCYINVLNVIFITFNTSH